VTGVEADPFGFLVRTTTVAVVERDENA